MFLFSQGYTFYHWVSTLARHQQDPSWVTPLHHRRRNLSGLVLIGSYGCVNRTPETLQIQKTKRDLFCTCTAMDISCKNYDASIVWALTFCISDNGKVHDPWLFNNSTNKFAYIYRLLQIYRVCSALMSDLVQHPHSVWVGNASLTHTSTKDPRLSVSFLCPSRLDKRLSRFPRPSGPSNIH